MTGPAQNIAVRGNKMSGRNQILDKPRCQILLAGTGAIATATPSAITFDTRVRDADGMWDGATGIYARTTGAYQFNASFTWAGSGAGTLRWAYFLKNASATHYSDDARPANGANLVWNNIAYVFELNAGDFIRLVVFQDTGGNLSSSASVGASASISACLISTIN